MKRHYSIFLYNSIISSLDHTCNLKRDGCYAKLHQVSFIFFPLGYNTVTGLSNRNASILARLKLFEDLSPSAKY